MKIKTNSCVQCGLPCLGSFCPNRHTYDYFCDQCGEEGVDYDIEDEELCEECTEKFLTDLFNQLSTEEKAKALDVNIHKL